MDRAEIAVAFRRWNGRRAFLIAASFGALAGPRVIHRAGKLWAAFAR